MIILKGHSTEHLDMLEGGVIQRLLEEKWKTFAQSYFYRRLCMMLFHLLNLSLAVYLRPTTREPLLGSSDVTSIVRYYAEVATLLGCVGFGIFQQAQEILAQGLSGFLVSLTTSPIKSTFLLSCLLILSCIPCRVLEDRETEDVLLTMAIPGSWFYLIFFAGAVRLTGPFVTMIYNMIVGDMFRFSIIYTIFLFGFTQAFYFLFKQPPNEKHEVKKRFSSYPVTWMGLFHMTLGSYDYEEFRETYYQKLTQLVFAIFMVFTPILLLNMLIAMMGNTYCEVIEQSEKEWVKQWANIIVALERSIDSKSAKQFIQTYSIKMPSPDKDTEVRGVIVIKTKLKSKAKEKKQALSLWKRVGKRTIQELRKVGGTAAEVRRRYQLFRPKQPTARLRMGKVVQEWNPASIPVFTDPVPSSTNATSALPNAGFNNLLTQVASASGIDIEKPTDVDIPTDVKNLPARLEDKLPNNIKAAEVANPNGFVNLAFESNDDLKSCSVPYKQEGLQSNPPYIQKSTTNNQDLRQSNPINQSHLNSNPINQTTLLPNLNSSANLQPNTIGQATQQASTYNQTFLQPNFTNQLSLQPSATNQTSFQSNSTNQAPLQPNTMNQALLQPNTMNQPFLQSNIINQASLQPSNMYQSPLQPITINQAPLQPSIAHQAPLQPSTMHQPNTINLTTLQPNTNNLNNCNMITEIANKEPAQAQCLENVADIGGHSEQFQPVKLTDDKGISVSIQTRIISTRVTKARIRRRKDSVFPLKNEFSDSTTEKETKRGFLLHKKEGNVTGFNFKGASKYKKRRKRNQISFQEKISVDNVPYDLPDTKENQ